MESLLQRHTYIYTSISRVVAYGSSGVRDGWSVEQAEEGRRKK